jgi:hypothetical protein
MYRASAAVACLGAGAVALGYDVVWVPFKDGFPTGVDER